MSSAAQLAFLSKLDTTAAPPNTVFVFTANETRFLADRFLSRCRVIEFTTEGIRRPLVDYLERIWRLESKVEPNRARLEEIAFQSHDNVREALMLLEMELIAPAPVTPPAEPEPTLDDAIIESLRQTAGHQERLAAARESGLTDTELLAFICSEYGTWGGRPVGRTGYVYAAGGTNPRLWFNVTHNNKPTLQGAALGARVRDLLSIPYPSGVEAQWRNLKTRAS